MGPASHLEMQPCHESPSPRSSITIGVYGLPGACLVMNPGRRMARLYTYCLPMSALPTDLSLWSRQRMQELSHGSSRRRSGGQADRNHSFPVGHRLPFRFMPMLACRIPPRLSRGLAALIHHRNSQVEVIMAEESTRGRDAPIQTAENYTRISTLICLPIKTRGQRSVQYQAAGITLEASHEGTIGTDMF